MRSLSRLILSVLVLIGGVLGCDDKSTHKSMLDKEKMEKMYEDQRAKQKENQGKEVAPNGGVEGGNVK